MYVAGDVKSKSKLHVSVGHMTVMADLEFFGLPDDVQHVAEGGTRRLQPLDKASPTTSRAQEVSSLQASCL